MRDSLYKYKVGDRVEFKYGDKTVQTEIAALTGEGTKYEAEGHGYYIVREWDGSGYGHTTVGSKRYWWVLETDLKPALAIPSSSAPTLDPSVPFPFTPAELLEYAKKTYPVGTTFIDCNMKRKVTVKDNGTSDIYSQGTMSGGPYILVNTDNGYEYILLDRKWAEVIAKPATESTPLVFTMTRDERLAHAKRLFPIGTSFRSPQNGNIYTVKEWEGHQTYKDDGDKWILVNTEKDNAHYEYLFLSTADPQWATVTRTAPTHDRLVVGQYIEALIDRPDGGTNVKKGEFARVKSLKRSAVDDKVIGAWVDFPNFTGYSMSLNASKYRIMPVGWTPQKAKETFDWEITDRKRPAVKIPEGVYGKFGDPLRATAKDIAWVAGAGGYTVAVDPYDSSKVAQMALSDPHGSSWYERHLEEQVRLMKTSSFPSFLKNKFEKKATILPLDSYTQQPLIIKQTSKIKTLKIV